MNPSNVKDETGKRYGRLRVIGRAGSKRNGYYSLATWHCECDCGAIVVVAGPSLRKGITRSCGCLRRDITRVIHARPDLTGNVLGEQWFWSDYDLEDLQDRFGVSWKIDANAAMGVLLGESTRDRLWQGRPA